MARRGQCRHFLAFFIFMYKYLPLLAATELKKVNPAFGGQIVST